MGFSALADVFHQTPGVVKTGISDQHRVVVSVGRVGWTEHLFAAARPVPDQRAAGWCGAGAGISRPCIDLPPTGLVEPASRRASTTSQPHLIFWCQQPDRGPAVVFHLTGAGPDRIRAQLPVGACPPACRPAGGCQRKDHSRIRFHSPCLACPSRPSFRAGPMAGRRLSIFAARTRRESAGISAAPGASRHNSDHRHYHRALRRRIFLPRRAFQPLAGPAGKPAHHAADRIALRLASDTPGARAACLPARAGSGRSHPAYPAHPARYSGSRGLQRAQLSVWLVSGDLKDTAVNGFK